MEDYFKRMLKIKTLGALNKSSFDNSKLDLVKTFDIMTKETNKQINDSNTKDLVTTIELKP